MLGTTSNINYNNSNIKTSWWGNKSLQMEEVRTPILKSNPALAKTRRGPAPTRATWMSFWSKTLTSNINNNKNSKCSNNKSTIWLDS